MFKVGDIIERNQEYKVGDIVELFERNQEYKIIDKLGYNHYSVKGIDDGETFLTSGFNMIDKQYIRKLKLNKICSKLEI